MRINRALLALSLGYALANAEKHKAKKCDLCDDLGEYEIDGAIVDCACTQKFPTTEQAAAKDTP